MNNTPIFEHNPLSYQAVLIRTLKLTEAIREYNILSIQDVPLFGLYTSTVNGEELWHIQPMLPVQSIKTKKKYKTMDEALVVMLGVLYSEYKDKQPLWSVITQNMSDASAINMANIMRQLQQTESISDIPMPISPIKID